jgi:ubiquinone/menaquinone biosynthesis C-methylase UbiE
MENSKPSAEQVYIHGYSDEHRAFLAGRTAEREAGFFLPYLKPGMRLLDCGSGMGALTASLAEALAPGEVVGVEKDPRQVESARLWAAQKAVRNVRFKEGDIHALPFPDRSFDAVFAYTVLEHLPDPRPVLREMRRVLKPGGVAGICDPDYATMLMEPTTPLLTEARRLMLAFSEENASPYYSRHLRSFLLDAGFARTEGFAQCVGGGNPQFQRFNYELVLKPTLENLRSWILQRRLADESAIDAMLVEAQVWSEKPDAFFSLGLVAAVGWIPG